MRVLNFVTNVIAWVIKNTNMVVGVIGALSKVAVGLINIFQPSKDTLVDTITEWTERAQTGLFGLSNTLKKFGESTR